VTRHGTRTGGSRRWVLVATIGAAVVVLAAVVALIVHSGQSGTATAAGASPTDVQVEDSQSEPVPSGSPTPEASTSPSPSGSASPSPSAGKSTAAAPGGGPTAGLKQYGDTYKVQQPYDLAVSARFSVTAGPTYNAWIVKGDKPFSPGSGTGPRTEMRWGNWTRVEHMWEADVLIDPGTDGAAIMQVKSNDGFEPVYVNVKNNGSLYNDSNKTVLATNMWGAWFHLVCAYDPGSGNGRVWINGRLTITRNDPHPIGTVWYFKNGVYNVTGDRAEAHFKNVRFWTR
jgi:hypothetical protein